MDPDQAKILEVTKEQIERKFGKGSLMRLGEHAASSRHRSHPDRLARARRGARRRRRAARPRSSRSTARSRAARPRSPCRSSPRRSAAAASPRSSTRSTPSTPSTPQRSASTSTTCSSRSRTPASRRSRSATCSSAAAPSTSSSSTRSPRSCPGGDRGRDGRRHVGLQARLMSQALRKLTGSLSKSNTTVHLHQPAAREDRRHVRQSRDHHGRPRAQVLRVGSHRRPPHRLDQAGHDIDRQPRPRQGREEQGRAAVPAGRVRHHVRPGDQQEGSLLDLGVEEGIVAKSGAWYTYGDERLGQGREQAKEFLKEHLDIRDTIETVVRGRLGLPLPVSGEAKTAAKKTPKEPAPEPETS